MVLHQYDSSAVLRTYTLVVYFADLDEFEHGAHHEHDEWHDDHHGEGCCKPVNRIMPT